MPSVLILAGGLGERFWPISTSARPKQYLPLTGNLPMILETVYRVKDLVGLQKIYVVTTKAQLPLVYNHVSVLPRENIIIEPEGRNTAPCLVLSADYIRRKEGEDEVIAVLPSDHFIRDTGEFWKSLLSAFEAAVSQQKIVTFGIRPDRPETGYGYIAVGPEIAPGIFNGLKFAEKPDYTAAERYLKSGGYLWNSGMFIFQIKTFIEILREHSPQLHKGFQELKKAKGSKAIAAIYNSLPRTSIDYGIMEKLPSFLVIHANFGWDDLGTWRSLETTHSKDQNGNTIFGNAELIDVSDSIIYAQDKLVAAIGVKDLVIVQSQDATLVCSKDRVGEVKQIVEKLKSAHTSTK